MVQFQPDGVARQDTLLRYRGKVPDLGNITVCFRFRVRQLRELSSIFSYAVVDEPNELLIGRGRCGYFFYLFIFFFVCVCVLILLSFLDACLYNLLSFFSLFLCLFLILSLPFLSLFVSLIHSIIFSLSVFLIHSPSFLFLFLSFTLSLFSLSSTLSLFSFSFSLCSTNKCFFLVLCFHYLESIYLSICPFQLVVVCIRSRLFVCIDLAYIVFCGMFCCVIIVKYCCRT